MFYRYEIRTGPDQPSITHGHIPTEWPGLADERHFLPDICQPG